MDRQGTNPTTLDVQQDMPLLASTGAATIAHHLEHHERHL